MVVFNFSLARRMISTIIGKKFLHPFHPPVNSGGALVPPHFIDINRGGTGPPCKATSIEWRCTGFF